MAIFDRLSKLLNKDKKVKVEEQKQYSSNPQTPLTKTLQDIIFDQCKESVNPNYIQEHAEKLQESMLEHLERSGVSPNFYDEVSSTDFSQSYPSRIANELNQVIVEKVTKTLQQYFPMEVFGEDIKRFYLPSLENILYSAQEQSNQVDFGQVCNKINKLIFDTQYFENIFIQQASRLDMDVDLFDIEMSAAQFEQARSKTFSFEEMKQLPEIALTNLNSNISQKRTQNETLEKKLQEANNLKLQLEEQQINLFKDRKKLRERIKQDPENIALQEELENSKQAEKNYIESIRQAKTSVESIKSEIERNNHTINYLGADLKKYSQMQQYIAKSRNGMEQI